MCNLVSLDKAVRYSDKRIKSEHVSLECFVTTDNILQNKAGITKATNLPPNGGKMPSYYQDNILVGNIRPYLRKIWFASRDGGCSADVLVFEVKSEYNPKYIYYNLFRDDFFQHMMRGAKGTKMPRGDKQQILNYVIPNHSLQVQQKIAAILTAIDDKIECSKKINAELTAITETLYNYWFLQFDFPDKNGKPYKSSGGKMVYNSILKREIPFGWKTTPLSLITPVSSDSINPADFPYQEYRHFSIPIFDATKTYGLEYGESIGSNKFFVEKMDLLVSKLNPWFSRVVYAIDEPNQICSTEFVVWRCPTDEIKNFLYLIATSQQFIAHCVQSATGTSNSHKRVNPTVMMGFEVPYHNETVKKFGTIIDPLINKIIVNQQEIKELMQLRDWLLPMLMNGQVTVQ